MTPLRTKSFIRKVKDITISSTLALAILSGGMTLQSCGSDSDDEYEYEDVEVYTKGVKTYISETSKGVFKISEEKEVPADSSMAIVTYLDGRQEKLSPPLVKSLIDNEIKTDSASIGEKSNLPNALLFGGMGYLLAKTVSPNYATYRPDVSQLQANNATSKSDSTQRRHYHRSHFGGGNMLMAYYLTSRAFSNSNSIHQNIGNSRTTISRPVGGRSGFFHSSSHGSHHS
ncbi:hypothetical protein [Emticicia sp. SJ17W-69]|uniref:hypothetical protein n=1 Tax=Emticicia sp. SJ17W-69 TaxID=3421657 RepID=UPI003EC0840B